MYQSNAGPDMPSVSQAIVLRNCLVGNTTRAVVLLPVIGSGGGGEDAISLSWIANLRPAR